MSGYHQSRVIKLLEASYGSESNPWISVRNCQDVDLTPLNGIGEPREAVYLRYLRQDVEKKNLNKQVDGLDQVLNRLRDTKSASIKIYELTRLPEYRYQILTDDDDRELLGVVRFRSDIRSLDNESRLAALKKLLRNTFGSRVNPWISTRKLRHSDITVDDGFGTSRYQLSLTYRRRAQLNIERDAPIVGFELLLRNLSRNSFDPVLIHGLIDDFGTQYRVFTNSECNQLVGILKLSKRVQGLF